MSRINYVPLVKFVKQKEVNSRQRYTWTLFLRSKDETPELLKYFLKMIQRNLQAQVISVRTDKGTEFLNKTLYAYLKEEGIEHQTSTPHTSEQNDVDERRNHTLVEAARTMLSASKLPLFFWVEAIATACYTQNRSIIILTHKKTSYHIINDRIPSIRHLHIFSCICYLTIDGENLDKMKEKGDPCVLVGYSTQSKGYRVYNKRTRLIVESIHLLIDEIKEMSETCVDNNTSGLVLQRQKASDYDNSSPAPQLQNVSPSADTTAPSQQELDLLFGPLYDEFFTASTLSVNKSSSPTDNSTQQDTPPTMNIQSSPEPTTSTTIVLDEENNDNQVIEAMQEELHQFNRLQVWELVNKPFGKTVIKLKLLWKNKKDEVQTVICNKARLVAKDMLKKRDYGFELTAFSDADHAGCIDRKSTFRGIQFLGVRLVSWMSKKQDCTAMSLPAKEEGNPSKSTSNSSAVVYQGNAKYEHVGQDTRSQDRKDYKDKQEKDLKISELKSKSKDNGKGSRSKITQHERTSLQRRQRPRPHELNDKSNLIDLMKEITMNSLWGRTGQEYDFTLKEGLKNKSQMVETASGKIVTPSGSASDRFRKSYDGRSWRGGDGGEEGVVVMEVTAVCGRRDGDGVGGWMVSMSVVVLGSDDVVALEEQSGVEWWLVWSEVAGSAR
ncbi:retrovirus-related pol polyprotein from transposon TNT 1-94 [Tanacetum coccineum]